MNASESCVTGYAIPAYSRTMPKRGRPPKPETTAPYPNRIADLRGETFGWSREELAEHSGVTMNVLAKLERGQSRIRIDEGRRIAAALGVSIESLDLGASIEQRKIAVVGYVGAGTEIFPFDDFPKGHGLRRVLPPAGLDPERTVAVEVRGDSMFPLGEGSVLFYRRIGEGVPFEAVNQMCIVKIAGDGPTLVKNLRRGYTRNHYNLLSSNAPPREDVVLEWAAPVLAILSPDLVQ